MFDIGFLELLLVAGVGLFVIGPERLPGTIKTCMLWFGRLKRSLSEARLEIEKQIGADEIRRELHNERVMESLAKLKESTKKFEQEIRDVGNTLPAPSDDASAPHANTADAATALEATQADSQALSHGAAAHANGTQETNSEAQPSRMFPGDFPSSSATEAETVTPASPTEKESSRAHPTDPPNSH